MSISVTKPIMGPCYIFGSLCAILLSALISFGFTKQNLLLSCPVLDSGDRGDHSLFPAFKAVVDLIWEQTASLGLVTQ